MTTTRIKKTGDYNIIIKLLYNKTTSLHRITPVRDTDRPLHEEAPTSPSHATFESWWGGARETDGGNLLRQMPLHGRGVGPREVPRHGRRGALAIRVQSRVRDRPPREAHDGENLDGNVVDADTVNEEGGDDRVGGEGQGQRPSVNGG